MLSVLRKVPVAAKRVVFCLTLLGLTLPQQTARAQVATPASVEVSPSDASVQRAELYHQLQEQAAVLERQSAVVKIVAKLVGPTVVHIEADVPQAALQYGRAGQVEEAGSGVIIQQGAKYYVLTNRHVINGASARGIRIRLSDGREIKPVQVWTDRDTDVGVMELSAANVVAATVGDSQKMEIGDFVLAVGSPFGLSHSITYGIISARGRRNLDLGNSGVRIQDFLQTDAAINPGNSGGPLINLRGEVIGINTAIASNSGGSEGIGFAIPVNLYMQVARQLIQSGRVAKPFLGVTLDSNFSAEAAVQIGLGRVTGARVTEITPNSPAITAGLKPNDVVLQFNGTPVEDDGHLVNLVNLSEPGKEVPVVLWRNRQTLQVKVTVAERTR
jgi:serine protease Do